MRPVAGPGEPNGFSGLAGHPGSARSSSFALRSHLTAEYGRVLSEVKPSSGGGDAVLSIFRGYRSLEFRPTKRRDFLHF